MYVYIIYIYIIVNSQINRLIFDIFDGTNVGKDTPYMDRNMGIENKL